jgi:glycosyltransferase involved in cell wall biosynthesis
MQAISICITVFNEAKTIDRLLDALTAQTFPADEIIIVDGGSTDQTLSVLKQFAKTLPRIEVFQVKGNRSVGRNAAIKRAKNDWIAITDAGCIPHQNWLEEMAKVQQKSRALVIAGYYDALAINSLQEAMVPYVFVMPDKVNEANFLPATRSMLLHKTIWEKIGGFDESLSDNEDYAFANKIKVITSISFAKAAKVSWLPRNTLQQFYVMLFRFARGDIKAGLIRPKVIFIFARYATGLGILLWLWSATDLTNALLFALAVILLYSIWAITKNLRYVPNGWYWLPVLQLTADAAVMIGSIAGTRD